MGLSNFIPVVWSANILKTLEKIHRIVTVANRE